MYDYHQYDDCIVEWCACPDEACDDSYRKLGMAVAVACWWQRGEVCVGTSIFATAASASCCCATADEGSGDYSTVVTRGGQEVAATAAAARGPWANTRMARGRLAGLNSAVPSSGAGTPSSGLGPSDVAPLSARSGSEGYGGGGGWQMTPGVSDSATLVIKEGANTPLPARGSGAVEADQQYAEMSPIAAAIASARGIAAASGDAASTLVIANGGGHHPSSSTSAYLGGGGLGAAAADVSSCPGFMTDVVDMLPGGSSGMRAEDDVEDSYMAALKSAVAERERQAAHQQQRGGGTSASSGRRAEAAREGGAVAGGQQVSAFDKLQERLHGAYENGSVVPLPFLSAAHAAPMGLFNPACSPGITPLGHQATVEGLDGDAYTVLADLAAEPAAWALGPAGRDHIQQQQQQERQLAPTTRGLKPNTQQLPDNIKHIALHNPTLQNLARSLAYHKACLEEMPLDKGAGLEVQQVVNDMTTCLRTILCL